MKLRLACWVMICVQAGFGLGPAVAGAQSLKGSSSSISRQERVAREHDYTRLKTPAQIQRFVRGGYLVRVNQSAHLELAGVSYPYARPEVRLLITRLAAQYYSATGEKLVVTSLTRPLSRQPANASQRSVHPCGMAVDIRRSRSASARRWLEKTLLSLEARGVLEATRERRPPHYHVAVFPRSYAAYVANKQKQGSKPETYVVRQGDSLWGIARSLGTSVNHILVVNDMNSNVIHPGQKLKVPHVE